MKRATYTLLSIAVFWSVATAQSNGQWTQMSVDTATKLLRSSPWAQTQTDTDTSEMFFSPTKEGSSSIGTTGSNQSRSIREQQNRNNDRTDRGAFNQALSIDYYVRFFSARPVREAISRIVMQNYPQPSPGFMKQWQNFIDRDFGPYIVLTVTYGAPDGRLLGPAIQAFNGSTASSLKNNTYLEHSEGKRIYLVDYRPPTDDGLGAKFVFPRFVDKERFLSRPKGSVRFVTDMGHGVKLNVKFNLADMVVSDRLEY